MSPPPPPPPPRPPRPPPPPIVSTWSPIEIPISAVVLKKPPGHAQGL